MSDRRGQDLVEALAEHGIRLKDYKVGNHYSTCPKCSHTRRKKNALCLSVYIDEEGGSTWNCKHCGWVDNVPSRSGPRPEHERRPQRQTIEEARKPAPDPAQPTRPKSLYQFFEKRGLSTDLIEEEGVYIGKAWFPQVSGESPCIVIPYTVDGRVVNHKYRHPKKHFVQDKDAFRSLYNIDALKDNDTAVWVEGECFPGDAEVLTPTGWCRLDAWNGEPVAQWHSDGRLTMATPTNGVRKQFDGELVHVSKKGYVSITTPNHSLVTVQRDGRVRKTAADSFPQSQADVIPRVGELDGPGIGLSDDQLRFAIAVAADATIDQRVVGRPHPGLQAREARYARFGLKRDRKIARLRKLADRCNLSVSDTAIADGYRSLCMPLPDWVPGRHLPHEWLTTASLRQRKVLLEELVHWDGNHVPYRNQHEFSTKHADQAVWAQTLAHTAGRCSTIIHRSNRWGRWFKVSILHGKRHTVAQFVRKTQKRYSGPVYCVSVPTSMLLVRQDGCITVSGNCDVLACKTAGIPNAISLPDGAPPAPKREQYDSDEKFNAAWERAWEIDRSQKRYLAMENCADQLGHVRKHIIATDGDQPGQILAHQIAQRVGPARCYRVQYPEGCKDLNEVLLQDGEQAVRDCVESARGYPVEGIYNVRRGDLVGLRNEPRPARYTLGVEPFDEIFGVRPGQVMLVTGVPGDGKSSFVDYLTVQLTKRYGWRWAVCSPEHDVRRHAASIAEKYAGQPFYAYEPGQTPMSDAMVNMSEAWVGRNYSFILQDNEDKPLTVDFILDRARTAKIRDGIQGLVIDPYNELEHERGNMSESEYAGVFLSRLRKYARASDLCIILVAHPAKLSRDPKSGKRPVPTPYDVAGCYSADTEVLTDRGWKRHDQIKKHWNVLCYDTATGGLQWQKPTHIHRYRYVGPMHHYTGYGADLLVTPDHRMVVKPAWQRPGRKLETPMNSGRPDSWDRNRWQFVRSRELTGARWKMPLAGSAPVPGNELDVVEYDDGYPAEAVMRLVGFYVSEGWVTQGSIALCQAADSSASFREALTDCGLRFSEATDRYRQHEKPMWRARVYKRSHPQLIEWILRECGDGGCTTKRLPSLTWSASAELKRALFDALMLGDGNHRKGGSGGWAYVTTSPQLADDVQRLAIELGMPAKIRQDGRAEPHHHDRYSVEIGVRKERGFYPSQRAEVEYDGEVWCLTVPTGAYVTRRNGVSAICGNSAHFYNKPEVCMTVHRPDSNTFTTDVYVQKMKWKEQGGRGQASFRWDKMTGLYYPLEED